VRGLLIANLCAAGLLLAAPAQSSKTLRNLAKAQQDYDHATNPVDRAKAMKKLGNEEYDAARQALQTGDQKAALQYLQDYYDKASRAHEELDKMGVDPEKHSNGFRQLQISVRERARELKELIGRVAYDQRKPFEDLEQGMDELSQKLIHELFPGHSKRNKDEKADNKL
jgi:hypothetical protein